jgi:UPF0755 protein
MQKRKILLLSAIPVLLLIISSILIVRMLFGLNIRCGDKTVLLYLPTGSTYEQVLDSINSGISIRNPGIFKMFAEKKRYPSNIKPGRYAIKGNLSYLQLLNMLRSGHQSPVNVTFNNIRTLNDLAGKVGNQIEADSADIIRFLIDSSNYSKDGFDRENIISVFIPNTYEFYWNTTAGEFYSRMLKEYRKFWNSERLAKAREKKLAPEEVSILASIIDCEASKTDEKPRIAGVYINRLRRNIPLQADPTIMFALNDFTVTRVLFRHLKTDSPYNTYMHAGLPPGPIGCPSISGLDAVLNAEQNDYLYFAAKADFSGYHNFSRTLAEHNRFAGLYQKELDKRKIFR